MRHLCRPAVLAAVMALLSFAGCDRAARYPAARKDPADAGADKPAPKREKRSQDYAWLEPRPGPDVAIEFVSAAADPAGWKRLPEFWNHIRSDEFTPVVAAAAFGLGPFEAAAALRAASLREVIRIRVPLGLPDPNPHIPPSNRPTYNQWQLGKKLFFDPKLLPGQSPDTRHNCASCHDPERGFTVNRPRPFEALRNPPTLINALYNRHQFWDGRVTHLEEVVQRTLDDETAVLNPPAPQDRPDARHAWPDVVDRLRGRPEYDKEFERVYGRGPTQANVARALATYVRTILSGDSVYDRAEAERVKVGDKELLGSHFTSALDERTVKALGGEGNTQEVGRELIRGHTLFYGRARCATCHPAPLFTDHDFHNAGVGESDQPRNSQLGNEAGRFASLPAGLKDVRYIGAMRTPTLRALPRTGPYFHDGSQPKLAEVLDYFNKGLHSDTNRYLDRALRAPDGGPQRLGLTASELRALELFLKSLDGGPVADKVAERPPAK